MKSLILTLFFCPFLFAHLAWANEELPPAPPVDECEFKLGEVLYQAWYGKIDKLLQDLTDLENRIDHAMQDNAPPKAGTGLRLSYLKSSLKHLTETAEVYRANPFYRAIHPGFIEAARVRIYSLYLASQITPPY